MLPPAPEITGPRSQGGPGVQQTLGRLNKADTLLKAARHAETAIVRADGVQAGMQKGRSRGQEVQKAGEVEAVRWQKGATHGDRPIGGCPTPESRSCSSCCTERPAPRPQHQPQSHGCGVCTAAVPVAA